MSSIRKPVYCRQEAYNYFVEQLPVLPTTAGLLHAAIAISMHALEDVQPQLVESQLQAYADRIKARAPQGDIDALASHLHEVLFGEEAFAGESDRFYQALNSYVPVVLKTKRGLPITLALIYKVVGSLAGLNIQGINAPAHFLAQVRCSHGWMMIDPFHCGEPVSQEEAHERIQQKLQREIAFDAAYFAPATHQQWISRILSNLQSLFTSEGRLDDLAAMTELQHALRQVPTTT